MFRNLAIGKKLALGFALVLIIGVGVGGYSILQFSRINETALEVSTNWMPGIKFLSHMRYAGSMFRRHELAMLLATTPEEAEKYRAKAAVDAANLAKAKSEYEPLISNADEKALYEKTCGAWEAYQAAHAQLAEALQKGDKELAHQIATGPCAAAIEQ